MVINRDDIIFGACPGVVAIVAELDLASSTPLSMPIDVSMLALWAPSPLYRRRLPIV